MRHRRRGVGPGSRAGEGWTGTPKALSRTAGRWLPLASPSAAKSSRPYPHDLGSKRSSSPPAVGLPVPAAPGRAPHPACCPVLLPPTQGTARNHRGRKGTTLWPRELRASPRQGDEVPTGLGSHAISLTGGFPAPHSPGGTPEKCCPVTLPQSQATHLLAAQQGPDTAEASPDPQTARKGHRGCILPLPKLRGLTRETGPSRPPLPCKTEGPRPQTPRAPTNSHQCSAPPHCNPGPGGQPHHAQPNGWPEGGLEGEGVPEDSALPGGRTGWLCSWGADTPPTPSHP